MDTAARVDVVLVAGGRWHDFGFARLQLLTELDRHDVVRTTVRDDYSDLASIQSAAALVTYTCDVRPSVEQADALAAWLEAGGRWLALHGTGSAVDPPTADRPYRFSTPRVIDRLVGLLGGQFLAHPPIGPYTVEVTDPQHPIVAGLASFTTLDELYVCEMHPPVDVLLHTDFDGECPGFVEGSRPSQVRQPVMWQKVRGAGAVTFLTLGHCCGRWDAADHGVTDTGVVDRSAWDAPGFRTVLARTTGWAVHGDAWTTCPNAVAREACAGAATGS
jgi:type 1 glutamine amidotransferase